jgi:hypothetical protein
MEFTIKNIDTDYIENKEHAIKYLTEINESHVIEIYSQVKHRYPKEMFICECVNYVTDKKIQSNIITDLKKRNWLIYYDVVFNSAEYIKQIEQGYSLEEKARIKSFIVSSLIEYECQINKKNAGERPSFNFEFIDKKTIKFNSLDWNEYYKKGLSVEYIANKKVNPKEEDITDLNEVVNYFSKQKKLGNKEAKIEVEYLIEQKEIIKDTIRANKLKPLKKVHWERIFVDQYAFKIFERFTENIANKHAGYSFIYRIMFDEGLIFNDIKDSNYRNWLEHNWGIIVDKTKPLYLIGSQDEKTKLYKTIKELVKLE